MRSRTLVVAAVLGAAAPAHAKAPPQLPPDAPEAQLVAPEPAPAAPISAPDLPDVPEPQVTIATAPPDPEPPPPPRPSVPRSAAIAIASAVAARLPDGVGRWQDLGRGAALSIAWLQRRADTPTGLVFRGMAVGNADARIYSLDVQLVASARLDYRRQLAPFVGVGLGLGSVRFARGATDKMPASGIAVGPAGSVGVHGFLSDQLYWRAEVSAVGAGAAVIGLGASLGWVFGT